MNFKKILLFLSLLFTSLISFSQQIGSGFAPDAIPSFNTELLSGFYQGSNATGAIDGGGWNHLLNLRHSTPGNNHQLQIASSYTENDRLFFRKFARALGSSNPTWHEIATRGVNTFIGNQIVSGELKISSYSPLLVLQRDTNAGGFIQGIQTKNLDNTDNWFFGNLHTNSWIVSKGDFTNAKFTILDGGNVGIGTATPASKLDVRGVISTPEIAFRNADGGDDSDPYRLRKVQGSSNNNWLELQLNDDPDESFRIYGNSCEGFGCGEYSSNLYHSFDAQGNVFHSGKVGIGTTTPDEKLTVNGTIHATEVKVTQTVPADYVFQKYYTGKSELKSDYVMPTLAEIESFTKENNHLPNVPSAKEIQEKGMSLGEMSNVLLQKVEELTLYAIEQNKKLEEQNKTIATLVARLTSLEKK